MNAAPAAALEPPPQIGANEDSAASAGEYEDADLVSGQEDSGSDDDESGTNEDKTDGAEEKAGSGDYVGGDTEEGGSEVALEGAAAPEEETSSLKSSPREPSLPGDGASAIEETVSSR